MADFESPALRLASERLAQIASGQGGYFTAKQAVVCGIGQYAHHYLMERGEWLRIDKGLYRLPGREDTPRTNWMRWLLWSRNNREEIQAVLCRESALAYYGLWAQPLTAVHLAVPAGFRKRNPGGEVFLYRDDVAGDDLLCDGILRVTRARAAVEACRMLAGDDGQVAALLEQAAAVDKACRSANLPGDATPPTPTPDRGLDKNREPETGARAGVEVAERGAAAEPKNITVATAAEEWIAAAKPEESAMSATPEDAPQARDQEETAMSGQQERGRKEMVGGAIVGGRPGGSFRRAARNYVRSNAAFTLVELLVVVAVIGILAALLMPGLRKAVDSARGLQCINSLKQLGTGNLMYANEYRNWCVPISYYDTTLGGHLHWGANDAFQRLFTKKAIGRWQKGMICPMATLALNAAGASSSGYMIEHSYGTGYDKFPTMSNYRGYQLEKIVNHSKQLFLIDANDWQVNTAMANPTHYAAVGEYRDGTYCVMTCYRHRMGANIVFYDGHAAWLPSEKIYNNQELWLIDK